MYFFAFLAILLVAMFGLLIWRNTGLLPLWIFVDYLQLISFLPLFNFKMLPWVYDIFKPLLVSHLMRMDWTENTFY